MALPASLLQQVERHGCFTGCYSADHNVLLCLGPNQPLQPALQVSCKDCLSFKVAVLQSLLPGGTTIYALADQLSQHNRKLRGYDLTFSSYHARGPGFWLSAAYYANCGLFLLDGSRSRSLGSDLDLLLLAFQHGVASPPDPRMRDPKLYSTQTVYVNYGGPVGPVACRQDLLAAPQSRQQPHPGFQQVTLAEFQPLARARPAAPPAPAGKVPTAAAAVRTPARQLKPGEICPVCKAEVKERALLNGTYVGCLC
jgi:hypothetical protein